jgi:glycosyltransferase involved in cell wall biosynthesis
MMHILFIHQSFPGQFGAIANAMAKAGHQVISMADMAMIRQHPGLHSSIKHLYYATPKASQASTHQYLRDTERHIRRGQEVCRSLEQLKSHGFYPDVIVVHPGWGESLFLKEAFPKARVIGYFEYYYQDRGGDVGFDPDFPAKMDDLAKIRIKNTTQLLSLTACDDGVSPTLWQKSRYPKEFQSKIKVIHEGINTVTLKPNHEATFKYGTHQFKYGDEMVTYVARNLEPYRGIHSFLRSLPILQKLRPSAQVIIVGGDDVSYGRRLPNNAPYREKYQKELADKVDWSKVHFVGQLPYTEYLKVLQISACHVYLTYPFVLSWSMLEAMSVGCVLVASSTEPVKEVITDQQNGILVDFFSHQEMAQSIANVLSNPKKYLPIRENARKTILQKYDQQSICIPQWKDFILGK